MGVRTRQRRTLKLSKDGLWTLMILKAAPQKPTNWTELPDADRQRADELLTKLLSVLSTESDLARLLQKIDDLKDGTDDPLELLERCVLLSA
jgi:hypothetical protein